MELIFGKCFYEFNNFHHIIEKYNFLITKVENWCLDLKIADDYLKDHFNINEFIFIENKNNKSINHFNLFKYAKHFIVGPTPFHWWGSWLNVNPDKICLRPSNINPSNNKDFWPLDWHVINV